MRNQMMVIVEDDFPPPKRQRPHPRKEERARILSFGNDEIGLLDLVLWDAIADNERCRR